MRRSASAIVTQGAPEILFQISPADKSAKKTGIAGTLKAKRKSTPKPPKIRGPKVKSFPKPPQWESVDPTPFRVVK